MYCDWITVLENSAFVCLNGLFIHDWKDRDTSDKHGEDAEYLLVTSVGRDVAEANTREAGAGEVESCDVGLCVSHVLNRHLELLCQSVGPACNTQHNRT